MAGLATYIIFLMIAVTWILGWVGLSAVVGMFFELPLKTTSLIGATLGPLGFLLTLMVGILENREGHHVKEEVIPVTAVSSPSPVDWDPFT